MILLAFRLTKHYWRLALRQLMLPVGLQGESFAYRREFVHPAVGEQCHGMGVICGKFDSTDFPPGRNRSSAYIPLRVVWNVNPELVPDSNVRYFNYTLGPSIDYRGREWHYYSNHIRAAVLKAMGSAGDAEQVDSDNVLVIQIDYSVADLSQEEELDRWIRLTRLLAGDDVYSELDGDRRVEVSRRYRNVAYGRVALVDEIGQTGRQSSIREGRVSISAGREFSVNFVTNLSPAVANFRLFSYRLNASDVYFEVIDDISEVSQGILSHRFLARCRGVFGGRTYLRMQAIGAEGVYAPDTVLPIRVCASVLLWPRILGAVLVILGLVIAYIGILPDGDLGRVVCYLTFLSRDLEFTRFLLRFGALTAASSGIGLSLFSQDRPR